MTHNPTLPHAISPTEARLREILARRIMILDGAMGTMIQQYKLTEKDYLGERFKDFQGEAGEHAGHGAGFCCGAHDKPQHGAGRELFL